MGAILIVDDDMAINDMLVKYLRKNGYLLHRREVTRLSQKLQTLLHSFTHAELTLDFPSSDITDLVNA